MKARASELANSTEQDESHADLRRALDTRTHELENALDQQTAIDGILRIIFKLADGRPAGSGRGRKKRRGSV